jgi:hypothetical protein
MRQSGPWRRSTGAFRRVLVGIAVLALAACGSHDNFRLTGDQRVPNGMVTNRDVRIVAVDHSFEITGGQEFSTPFQSDLWSPEFDGFPGNPPGFYPLAIKHGAKRVVIYIGGDLTPLYGVLAFNPASKFSYGPGTQYYRLSITDAELQSAKDGNVAVSYEKVNWTRNGANNWWLGSVLWLSGGPLE